MACFAAPVNVTPVSRAIASSLARVPSRLATSKPPPSSHRTDSPAASSLLIARKDWFMPCVNV